MAMLAERKRKQKWSLNPRGKEWSQDANKFGQKLLEKMGWQHGKGLGAKEDGITEHVKVSYKNDSKGMGYKESNDQWTEHESNFSALLESLTGTSTSVEEIKVSSLEQKSQSSKARVHYHKFTRGKDLSRYSEKDLANIFGRKNLKTVKKQEIVVEKEDNGADSENNSGFLVNAGSMRDYFKKKLPSFGIINGYVIGNNGVLKKDESESESEIRPTFGFGFTNGDQNAQSAASFVSYITEDKEKKRKAEEIEESVSPKKKSKKDQQNPEENLGVSNPAFNPMATPVKVQKHLLHTIEESTAEEVDPLKVSPIKKKKKKCSSDMSENLEESVTHSESNQESSKRKKKNKDKKEPEEGIGTMASSDTLQKKKDKKLKMDNPSFDDKENFTQIGENPYEIKVKKKKQKKLEIDNPIFLDLEDESMNSSQIEPNPYEVKVKKKKQNKLQTDNYNVQETINEVPNSLQVEENPFEVKVKKKKSKETTHIEENSKSKGKKKKLELDNPIFDETDDTTTDISQIEENPYEIRVNQKKKKKKEKKMAIDNPSFEDHQEKPIDSINPYEVKTKKKKKNKGPNPGIINPALDLNDSQREESVISEDFDLMLNVVSTPITAKEETRTPVGSVRKMESFKNRKSVRFSDVTQELIIPNNEELREMEEKSKKEKKKGLDNQTFDKQKTNLDENVDSMAKTLDNYQAEIENDINEEKTKTVTMEDLMVGEVGNPDGENEALPEGTKLKFKYANLDSKTPFYHTNQIGPRKSYKHLIKGDILLGFKNTNLHEINGYGYKSKTQTIN